MNICMGCMEKYNESFDVCPFCGYIKGLSAKESYHLQPESILVGRYIIGKVLGYGGFGVTYIGWDEVLQRKIAIKEYLPSEFSTRMPGQTEISVFSGEHMTQFDAGLISFVDESKRLAKFNYLEGIVDIYDSFMKNNTGYIIMEYLPGKTIKDILSENGIFQFEEAKTIILSILNILKEVHKESIIHRDISPDNIFITTKGEVKLIDFGASRYAAAFHTKSLSVILKPGYAPEEQYRSRGNQGSWSDIYAVSATFYKMITGITPDDSMERFMEDTLLEPSKLNIDIPLNAENAIMNALNVRIENRTQTAEEFIGQLTEAKTVTRTKVAKVKNDLGKYPTWLKISLSVLASAITIIIILIATGNIKLTEGAFSNINDGQKAISTGNINTPGVINKFEKEAELIATENKLTIQIIDSQYTKKTPEGKIMSQEPLTGREIKIGGIINLIASAGPESAYIIDVVNKSKNDAIKEISGLGFKTQIKEEFSEDIPKDSIIRQQPETGTKFPLGEVVNLVVSKGSEHAKEEKDVIIPSVENKSFEEAKAILSSIGVLINKSGEKYSTNIKENTIISQNPKPNETIKTGSVVEVVISLGIEKTRVPDVQYKTEKEARNMLSNAKLNVNIIREESSTVQKGNITRQLTKAGTEVTINETITIYVSNGSKTAKVVEPTKSPTPKATKIPEPVITETPATPKPVATEKPATPKPVVTETPSTPKPVVTETPSTPKPAPTTEQGLSIYLNKSSMSMMVGDTEELSYTITPESLSSSSVIWKSSDPSVVTVKNGVVKAISEGSATISIKSGANGYFNCTVNVVRKTIPLKSINLSSSDTTIYLGSSKAFTAILNPSDATNQKVTWTLSNTKVANIIDIGVGSDGRPFCKVKSLQLGMTTLTVAGADGLSTSCQIYIDPDPDQGISFQ